MSKKWWNKQVIQVSWIRIEYVQQQQQKNSNGKHLQLDDDFLLVTCWCNGVPISTDQSELDLFACKAIPINYPLNVSTYIVEYDVCILNASRQLTHGSSPKTDSAESLSSEHIWMQYGMLFVYMVEMYTITGKSKCVSVFYGRINAFERYES